MGCNKWTEETDCGEIFELMLKKYRQLFVEIQKLLAQKKHYSICTQTKCMTSAGLFKGGFVASWVSITQANSGQSVFLDPDDVLVCFKYLLLLVNPLLSTMPVSWWNLSLAIEQGGNVTANLILQVTRNMRIISGLRWDEVVLIVKNLQVGCAPLIAGRFLINSASR